MIYKIDSTLFNSIEQNLPFLNFNETTFHLLSEAYYSRNAVFIKPWSQPMTIHRLTGLFEFDKKLVDFEKDFNIFKKCIEDFFNEKFDKTFNNVRHFLLQGNRDELSCTEVSDWQVLENTFKCNDIKSYLSCERLLVRIPCGAANLNIVKFVDFSDLFLEITTFDADSQKLSNSLKKNLNLIDGLETSWIELLIQLRGQ